MVSWVGVVVAVVVGVGVGVAVVVAVGVGVAVVVAVGVVVAVAVGVGVAVAVAVAVVVGVVVVVAVGMIPMLTKHIAGVLHCQVRCTGCGGLCWTQAGDGLAQRIPRYLCNGCRPASRVLRGFFYSHGTGGGERIVRKKIGGN